ncbi:MAG: enolase C-terminal domain-like protein [Bacteroidota bacterium]
MTIPRVAPFRSAIGPRHARQALLVRWTDADGQWGIGECSCRPDPFFNGEFVDGAIAVIRDFIFPHLPRRGTVAEVLAVLERVRGWPFTVASVLDALFDSRRRAGHPDPLEAAFPETLAHVPVGISLPLFEAPEEAVACVAEAVVDGYRRVKLKVSPGMTFAPLYAVREAFPAIPLGFDANGSCGEAEWDFLSRLVALRPHVLEQPFSPRRLDLCVALKAQHPALRLCLDESITGLGDVLVANQLGAMDQINLKPGRVGGIVEAVQIMRYASQQEIPMWVGGMFETGIGRTVGLRVAARLPGAKAHDLRPPLGYLTADLVTPALTMDSTGQVPLVDVPVTLDDALLDRYTTNMVQLERG